MNGMRKSLVIALTVLFGMLSICPPARAADQTQSLTLEQAVEMALSYSPSLKTKELSLEQAEYEREAAATAVSYTPTGQADAETEKAFNNLVQKDLNWQVAKKEFASQKDSVTIQVYQAYFNVLQAQAALTAAEKSYAYADYQKRAAVLKHQFGKASLLEVKQQENSCQAAQAQLETAKQNLEDAYLKLDQLIGLSSSARPVLTDEPAYDPVEITSIEAEVSRALDESPTVKRAQLSVNQAQIALDIYSFSNAEYNSYKAQQLSIPMAEQNLVSAKNQLEQQVRSLYSSITQLEKNYQNLLSQSQTAQQNLEWTQLKLKYGAASRMEVAQAEAEAAKAYQSLLEAKCQHAVLAKAFATPWAYSGS
ncbi:MAG TPA: TolC family protein [Syntrophothermus lipocalidus]|nr:TolC family protein [Syntrophothermus lipocalidus]